jgi:hypothetical protein
VSEIGCYQQWLDTERPQGENMDVLTTSISERYEHGRSASAARTGRKGRSLPFRAGRSIQLMLLATGAYFCSSCALWAQTSDSQSDEANKSWTVTSESRSSDTDPIRTIVSHTQSGDRTLDKQSLQRRGADGHFEPYQDIEKETVQVDPSTVRTITRTFDRDADAVKKLVEVIEEQKRTSPAGESNVERITSDPDINGNLQLVQRQIEETKKSGANVEETKTTVMLPSADGGLVPGVQVQERRERGANDTLETHTVTLLPDGNGNWQVSEIRNTTTKQEADKRSTEERVSLPDSEGKLVEVSRTVSKEAKLAPGEKRNTLETYSVSVTGATPDGSLHLVGRATTNQRSISTGQQVSEQKVEQSNPGDPGAGLQVTVITTDTMRTDPSGAQSARTVRARNANGSYDSYGVVTVDTTKSDKNPDIQVQIAPVNPK